MLDPSGRLPVGYSVAGRYELRRFLGEGGMGTVYEAFDRKLEDKVALKILKPDFAHSVEMERRFRHEIKLSRRIRHPNVCAIHEYGEAGPLRYISMELIEGTDLKRRLRESGALPAAEAFRVAIQIAQGLDSIHKAGVVHRDLKASNVMLDVKGDVRLMDFGIAKQLGVEATVGATAVGSIIGTPEYMSPEQGRGETIDFRSDLYSLGIVIYEIFTGDVPFRGDTPIATIFKTIQDPLDLDAPAGPGHPGPAQARADEGARQDRRGALRLRRGDVRRAGRRPRRDTRPRGHLCLPADAHRIPDGPHRRRPDDADAHGIADADAAADPGRTPTRLSAHARARPTRSRARRSRRPVPPPARRQRATSPRPSREGYKSVLPLLLAGVGLGLLVVGGAAVVYFWLPDGGADAIAQPRRRATIPPTTLPTGASSSRPRRSRRPLAMTTDASEAERDRHTRSRDRAAHHPAADHAARPAATADRLARPHTLAQEPGHLQLYVRPWANVTVDGRAVGTTPMRPLTLAAGHAHRGAEAHRLRAARRRRS